MLKRNNMILISTMLAITFMLTNFGCGGEDAPPSDKETVQQKEKDQGPGDSKEDNSSIKNDNINDQNETNPPTDASSTENSEENQICLQAIQKQADCMKKLDCKYYDKKDEKEACKNAKSQFAETYPDVANLDPNSLNCSGEVKEKAIKIVEQCDLDESYWKYYCLDC